MPGRRHTMDRIGTRYEDAARLLLSSIASMVKVPREEDFGIDYYCHPRLPLDRQTETVKGLAGLQVKAEGVTLKYGGLDSHGQWQQHEVEWLTSLAIPLYLVSVARDCRACSVYSLGHIWNYFMGNRGRPFEIRVETQRPGSGGSRLLDQSVPERSGARRWVVDVGPPILRLSIDDGPEAVSSQLSAAILQTWIASDRANVIRFLQSIPVFDSFSRWTTNCLHDIEPRIWQFWSTERGANLDVLCEVAEPLMVSLGIHLRTQDNSDAYSLVPLLEWLKRRSQLGGIGRGLLEQLLATQQQGLSPGHDLSPANPTVEYSPEVPPSEEGDCDETNS